LKQKVGAFVVEYKIGHLYVYQFLKLNPVHVSVALTFGAINCHELDGIMHACGCQFHLYISVCLTFHVQLIGKVYWIFFLRTNIKTVIEYLERKKENFSLKTVRNKYKVICFTVVKV